MGCDERGRARGIDDEAGTDEIEEIGKAVGHDAQCHTHVGIGVDGRPFAREELYSGIIERRDPDVHASPLAGQRGKGQTSVFDGLVGDFEQKPLLGIRG